MLAQPPTPPRQTPLRVKPSAVSHKTRRHDGGIARTTRGPIAVSTTLSLRTRVIPSCAGPAWVPSPAHHYGAPRRRRKRPAPRIIAALNGDSGPCFRAPLSAGGAMGNRVEMALRTKRATRD